jgi:hypothetical protein
MANARFYLKVPEHIEAMGKIVVDSAFKEDKELVVNGNKLNLCV